MLGGAIAGELLGNHVVAVVVAETAYWYNCLGSKGGRREMAPYLLVVLGFEDAMVLAVYTVHQIFCNWGRLNITNYIHNIMFNSGHLHGF